VGNARGLTRDQVVKIGRLCAMVVTTLYLREKEACSNMFVDPTPVERYENGSDTVGPG